MHRLYLASRSPRRLELLQSIGVHPIVLPADVDESRLADETPEDYVRRLAIAKAQYAYNALPEADRGPVLGSDTTVLLGGGIMGKPRDRTHALAMLARLSGRTHRVLTGVALVNGRVHYRINDTRVSFRPISRAEAEAYWRSGEPMDKAGGYAIQGLGGIFVSGLEGSHSGVMGLPLFETAQLLTVAGFGLLR